MHNRESVVQLLERYEARGAKYHTDIVWSDLSGGIVKDLDGQQYIDFSSCALVVNAGHGCEEIKAAILDTVERGLLASHRYPTIERGQLVKLLHDVTFNSYKTALFNSGSEAVEAVIKIVLNWHAHLGRSQKNKFVSYRNSFHGKSLGASLLSEFDPSNRVIRLLGDTSQFVKIDFPDDSSDIESQIGASGIDPDEIACIMIEPYQGIRGKMAPPEYMRRLADWCKSNDVVLAVDEIQSGFGRTGRVWAYEHFDIKPDLIVCGKGMSSSLPISAVIGAGDLMDASPPRSIASTHSGNPVCCAASYASITKIISSEFMSRVADSSRTLQNKIRDIANRHPDKIVEVNGIGLMVAIQFASHNKPIAELVVENASKRGLLLYRPYGVSAGMVKISPPLTITEADLCRGLEILDDVIRLV
ncbi:aspartate aminotransferase family protein [Rhizobium rhizogenes]|uniref:aspartate aminotransferase family protein n=1 Tax=Rhizobium rhizogenes TaxID=359 RepID=UPI0015726504|nr:aspartate aminotransferase family protein [Rhizobium rhizogenes]NTF72686.1 aspartate aminotransferase family protein [Rhizobium rhizogenes]